MRLAPMHVSPNGRRALNSQTDVLGQEVLLHGEPSLENVGHYFPAMLRPRVPISIKEHVDAEKLCGRAQTQRCIF